MKSCSLLFSLILCTAPLHADPPAGENWTPIPEFTDEFDAKTLDLKKWKIGNPTNWRGREPGLHMDHNVTVQNGKLLLKMQAEKLVDPPSPGYRDFSCSSVTSRNRVRYGYFEVKAKIMSSKGASSFWFFNDTPELWTEIDVFEMCAGGSKEAGKLHTNVHVIRAPGLTTELTNSESFVMPDDPSQNFHVYGMEWDLQFIRWYLDGKLVRKLANTHWTQTLYLLFDTEIMEPWFGLPDQKTLPSVYEIDFVHAWQKRG